MLEKNKISLKDFKSWLQGVEDMQEEGWVPNKTQWQKIRQKIDQIEESPATVSRPVSNVVPPTTPLTIPSSTHSSMTPPVASSLDTGPKVSTFMPPAPRLENPKTPDIDTSNGQYTTIFT